MTSHYPCNDNSVPALAEKNATRNVIVFDCEEWGIFYQQCSTVQVLAGAGFYFTRTQCKFNVRFLLHLGLEIVQQTDKLDNLSQRLLWKLGE